MGGLRIASKKHVVFSYLSCPKFLNILSRYSCAPILFAGKNFREDNAATTKAAARQIITSTAASHRQTATEKGEL